MIEGTVRMEALGTCVRKWMVEDRESSEKNQS